jgi:hypothetical protein
MFFPFSFVVIRRGYEQLSRLLDVRRFFVFGGYLVFYEYLIDCRLNRVADEELVEQVCTVCIGINEFNAFVGST